jgi:hypothetical protein
VQTFIPRRNPRDGCPQCSKACGLSPAACSPRPSRQKRPVHGARHSSDSFFGPRRTKGGYDQHSANVEAGRLFAASALARRRPATAVPCSATPLRRSVTASNRAILSPAATPRGGCRGCGTAQLPPSTSVSAAPAPCRRDMSCRPLQCGRCAARRPRVRRCDRAAAAAAPRDARPVGGQDERRLASVAVVSLWWDLHPQECARAGRAQKTRPAFDSRRVVALPSQRRRTLAPIQRRYPPHPTPQSLQRATTFCSDVRRFPAPSSSAR